jgi:glycine betaine/proline transport system substrate-binding protein
MMRRAFGAAFFASSLIVGLPQSYGAETDDAERTIVLGALDWDGARAIQGVLQVVLEDRLGLHVDVVSAHPSEIVAAMDRGRGEIDVFPDF